MTRDGGEIFPENAEARAGGPGSVSARCRKPVLQRLLRVRLEIVGRVVVRGVPLVGHQLAVPVAVGLDVVGRGVVRAAVVVHELAVSVAVALDFVLLFSRKLVLLRHRPSLGLGLLLTRTRRTCGPESSILVFKSTSHLRCSAREASPISCCVSGSFPQR